MSDTAVREYVERMADSPASKEQLRVWVEGEPTAGMLALRTASIIRLEPQNEQRWRGGAAELSRAAYESGYDDAVAVAVQVFTRMLAELAFGESTQ